MRNDSLMRVTYVGLSGESVTDADLVHLQGLSQLQTLVLIDTKVTDAGLVHLQGLIQLQDLNLRTARSPTLGWHNFKV